MIVMRGWFQQAIVSGLLAAAALIPQAHADTRTTSFSTFLHVGPGRQYAVSDEIPTRTAVDVVGCENDWCQIRYGGASGWIEQRMLVAQGQPAPAAVPAGNCVDFARTGWPNSGDHERVCLGTAAPPPSR